MMMMTNPNFEISPTSVTFTFKNGVVVRIHQAEDGLGDVSAWLLSGGSYDFLIREFVVEADDTKDLMNSDEIAKFLWELS